MAERLREDGREASGGAAGLGQVARPGRRPRLLQVQGVQPGQEGQLRGHLRHRLDRRHLDRPDRQARPGGQALLPPGQRVRAACRERPQRESRPLRGRGRARPSGPGPVQGGRAAELALDQREGHLRQAQLRRRQGRADARPAAGAGAALRVPARGAAQPRSLDRPDHAGARGVRGARRHGRHLRLRQRHLPRRAPAPGRQGPRLRGGRAHADGDAGPGEVPGRQPAGPRGGRADLEHRHRTDDRRPRRLADLHLDRGVPGDGRALARRPARRRQERLAGPAPAAPGADPERRRGRGSAAGPRAASSASARGHGCTSSTPRSPIPSSGSAPTGR